MLKLFEIENVKQDEQVVMKFDVNTIQHLGISLYSTLPPVICEFISNSWDADSTELHIDVNDEDPTNKNISISDNGHGMSLKEISDTFLRIGRNRRIETSLSKKFKRKVIGKKGVGKLSAFGIAEIIKIETVKDKKKLTVVLDINEIASCKSGKYNPKYQEEDSDDSNGTKISLLNLKRKTSFDIESIIKRISNSFSIIKDSEQDKEKFIIYVKHNNGALIKIDSLSKYNCKDKFEFIWKFPEDFPENDKFKYGRDKKIKGKIFTEYKPISDGENGLMLISNGKCVNRNSFFDLRENDLFHSYVTGYLEIDYIDNITPDMISTDRSSLIWSTDESEELRIFISSVLNYVSGSWRNKREENKEKEILKKHNINIKKWIETLPRADRSLAKRVMGQILSSQFDTASSAELAGYVKTMFNVKSFQDFLVDLDSTSEPEKLIEMFKKWELVEATELANLAKIRLRAIEQFEKHIDEDSKEVPTIHNFLKQFPWILDPRIIEFRDEVRYSEILKETFPEEEVDGKNKRIDFLCHSVGETLYVIEIKRPSIVVGLKEINQIEEYMSFVQDKFINNHETSFKSAVGYIISNEKEKSTIVEKRLEQYQGWIYYKSYEDMLRISKAYHQEFIDKKNKLEEKEA